MKPLQEVADYDRVVAPGLAGFHLVSAAGSFGPSITATRDLMVSWRKRSASAIEKILAWHLTQARNRANLSQSALAKAVGRPQSFVAKIELNRRPVDVAELVQLCAAMEQDPCKLLMTVVQARSIQQELTLIEILKSGGTLQREAVCENAPAAPRPSATRAFDAQHSVIRRFSQREDEQ